MFDIRQFKFVLYSVMLLGITGFCIAAQTPELWLLATGAIALNAWMVRTGRFAPMPQMLANIVTLGSVALLMTALHGGDATPILTIAEFLVVLQIIKLYEQRANRDFGQILILSLLLMISAAISTPSLLFGVTFLVYLFLSLYCCLLFHLKTQNELAHNALAQPPDKLSPTTRHRDNRLLSRSMRRMTTLITTVAIVVSVVVFLFTPRGSTGSLFNPIQLRPAQAMTGFNDRVSFQKVAQIARSDDPIARVVLYKNDQLVTSPRTLLLRGSALDVYTGDDPNGEGRWTWLRSHDDDDRNFIVRLTDPDRASSLVSEFESPGPDTGDYYRQVITLQPTGTNKLFAMAGAYSISIPGRTMQIMYSLRDGVLETGAALRQQFQYTVTSSGIILPAPLYDPPAPYRSLGRSVIDPQIRPFAEQPAVCGSDSGGSLARYPLADPPDHRFDHDIAANIENYLHRNFTYSLDLTNTAKIGDRDPIVAFLTDFKQGHCEYFAGAMTLMCQSLGIPARMIVGFRCDPTAFNTMGNYFLVKDSDAHAWCEVFTGKVWETFDPTTSRLAQATTVTHKGMSKFASFLDYLEYKWGDTVVAYDRNTRKNLINNINLGISKSAVNTSQDISHWWSGAKWKASSTIIGSAIAIMALAALLGLLWYALKYIGLHRRAKRIGLETLPPAVQIQLARQLAFYDDLVRILEDHQLVRLRHQTPLEFSRSLTLLPGNIYQDILRLTNLFYRIRYGARELNPPRQKRVSKIVARVRTALGS